jgi:hypothetical protein
MSKAKADPSLFARIRISPTCFGMTILFRGAEKKSRADIFTRNQRDQHAFGPQFVDPYEKMRPTCFGMTIVFAERKASPPATS